MTPFSAWAVKREQLSQPYVLDGPGATSTADLNTEFQGLLDALIDNLSSSSAAQLSLTLHAMNASWCEHESQKITAELQTNMRVVEDRIMASLSEAMRPVMSDIHLKRTMQAFTETLRKLLPEFDTATVTIKAPVSVHGLLAETLGEQQILAELLHNDTNTISAMSNSVAVRADLEDWAALRPRANAS
jgi:hypothetical protein